jgi:putative copper export protein
MMLLLTWIIRYGHVLGAAVWAGGYALLAFLIVPTLGKGTSETVIQLAVGVVRFLTYAGTLTIAFGIVLITRTNGFEHLFSSAWGMLIITAFVLAIILLGIGDGALRPAIRNTKTLGNTRARLWATIGFIFTVLAIGVMTGATYVG